MSDPNFWLNFERFWLKTQQHDVEHYSGIAINTIDPLCVICYPVDPFECTPLWARFWLWFSNIFAAISYSQSSLELFTFVNPKHTHLPSVFRLLCLPFAIEKNQTFQLPR